MTTPRYTLDEFVHDMEDLLKSEPENQKIFDTGSDWLAKLTRNPENIPAEYRVPLGGTGPRANLGSYLLYQDDSGLQVTAVVWGPGAHLGPHNHHTWGMTGVLENSLIETRYRRVDDRSKDGFARLEFARKAKFSPGEITLLVPNVDEIHQWEISLIGPRWRSTSTVMTFGASTGAVTTLKPGRSSPSPPPNGTTVSILAWLPAAKSGLELNLC